MFLRATTQKSEVKKELNKLNIWQQSRENMFHPWNSLAGKLAIYSRDFTTSTFCYWKIQEHIFTHVGLPFVQSHTNQLLFPGLWQTLCPDDGTGESSCAPNKDLVRIFTFPRCPRTLENLPRFYYIWLENAAHHCTREHRGSCRRCSCFRPVDRLFAGWAWEQHTSASSR